jgi:hypothetical protein
MARCESKGKRAFYFKTSLLKPVYDLVEFSFKLPLERSVPVIFSSMPGIGQSHDLKTSSIWGVQL